jgi:hypothetical protein
VDPESERFREDKNLWCYRKSNRGPSSPLCSQQLFHAAEGTAHLAMTHSYSIIIQGDQNFAVHLMIAKLTTCLGLRGGAVVEELRYKPEGRGFDSRWCNWNFSLT